MAHEAEILQQKAEIGIQAGCLAHDSANLITPVSLIEFIPKMMPVDLPARKEIQHDVDTVMESIAVCRQICRGFTNYLRDIGEPAFTQPIPPLLQPLDIYGRRFRGTLVREISDGIPDIKCKGYQLKRVFVNLFVNACQAIEKQSEQKITIRLWHEDGRVLFSIEDNGPGIPVESQSRIFEERFTTKPEGTGLFLVKQIVDAHGGIIEVVSGKDGGATFLLSFPAG